MRLCAIFLVTFLLTLQTATAQSNQDFSGAWNLNPARSEIQSSVPGDPAFKVEQNAASLTWSAGATTPFIYPLDGRVEKRRAGAPDFCTPTQWEGAALPGDTLVSWPHNHA